MIINISKERNPVAKWFNISHLNLNPQISPEYVTLGKVELCKVLKAKNIPLDSLKNSEWLNNNLKKYGDIKFSKRNDLLLGDYKIQDGIFDLYNSINRNKTIDFKGLTCIITDSDVVWITDKQDSIDKLYFTAPQKYRTSILQGKQPLRSTEFYRNILNHSKDITEGFTYNHLINNEYIKNSTVANTSFDSFIFSLHDNNIIGEEKSKYGEDTYEIVDINEWILKIYNQVDNYFLNSKIDYVGSIIMLKRVVYKDYVFSENYENELKGIINTNGSGKIINCIFSKTFIPDSFIETFIKDHFSKPKKYEGEHEIRLSIVPLSYGKKDCGFLSGENNYNLEQEIWMDIIDYNKVIKLVQ